ncbi:TPA: hypothetical protein DDZ86_01845 [Candidatus Dependentiae bacterium]|nr:hypothetical protein [Candidatus Dependentiae bacterium]
MKLLLIYPVGSLCLCFCPNCFYFRNYLRRKNRIYWMKLVQAVFQTLEGG